jgi:hypothetical protein
MNPPATQWTMIYGAPPNETVNSLVQTGDGGYALAGENSSTFPSQPMSTTLLIKTDSAGNKIWNKTYGSFAGFATGSLVQTVDGEYAVEGYTSADYYLVKPDSYGNLLWNQKLGFYINSLVQTNDGGYLLAGGSMLVKIDTSGVWQWDETFEGVIFHVSSRQVMEDTQ